jgi:hypothetical protein
LAIGVLGLRTNGSLTSPFREEESMLYALFGWMHAVASRRARAIVNTLEGERGQGTLEYVGLILLVSP